MNEESCYEYMNAHGTHVLVSPHRLQHRGDCSTEGCLPPLGSNDPTHTGHTPPLTLEDVQYIQASMYYDYITQS